MVLDFRLIAVVEIRRVGPANGLAAVSLVVWGLEITRITLRRSDLLSQIRSRVVAVRD